MRGYGKTRPLLCAREFVVIGMRANPNPCYGSRAQATQRTVMVADSDCKAIFAAFQATKVQRRMARVLSL